MLLSWQHSPYLKYQRFFKFGACVSTVSTCGTGTVPPLLLVEMALYHQCIGGIDMFPSLVMEMQTGSTIYHISLIFFVLAAPIYWWDWLVAPVLMVRYKSSVILAAHAIIDRSMTIRWAGVSGKGNKSNPRWQPKLKEKRTSITTVRDQFLSFTTFPTPLVSHWSLPLSHT
jgi:hypothetical protein